MPRGLRLSRRRRGGARLRGRRKAALSDERGLGAQFQRHFAESELHRVDRDDHPHCLGDLRRNDQRRRHPLRLGRHRRDHDHRARHRPRRAWWCAIGNPLSWPTPGTNAAIQVQSDYQDLEQSDLGQITGGIGGHLSAADAAIWCERGIYRVQYVGSSGGIFSFQVAEGAAGTQAPLSIVLRRMQGAYGSQAVGYYLGDDDFYAFNGMASFPIGTQKIARTVIADLNSIYVSTVQGGTIPNLPIVYWLYASASGAGTGLYDRLVLYNPIVQRWSLCDLTATPAEWGTVALAPGMTLDALNAFGAIDTLPAALDSGFYAGGLPVLAAFDQNHKLNFLNGPPMAPVVETSEMQPLPGRRTKILSARPIVDGGSPSVSFGHRDRIFDSVTYDAARSEERRVGKECSTPGRADYER